MTNLTYFVILWVDWGNIVDLVWKRCCKKFRKEAPTRLANGKSCKRRLQENRFWHGRCYRTTPRHISGGGKEAESQGCCCLRCWIKATVFQNSLSRNRNRSLPTGVSSSEVSMSLKASKFRFFAHSMIFSPITFRSFLVTVFSRPLHRPVQIH